MTMKPFTLAILIGIASATLAQEPQRSIADLKTAASAGDVGAQFALGEAYRTGTGIAADRDQAITWYRRAADRGDNRAADALGFLLFTKGDRKTAIPLLQISAGRGDPRALYVLGTAHFNGDYVPKDWPRAYAEMRRAAAAGLPQAARSLALMEPYLSASDRAQADAIVVGMPSSGGGVVARPSVQIAQPKPAPPVIVATPAPPLPPPAITTIDLPASKPASTTPSEAQERTWRIQLGAYGSAERAEAQWTMLAGKIPTLGRYRRVTEPAGALVRLQAAGLANREDAAALCREITATGAACFVVGAS